MARTPDYIDIPLTVRVQLVARARVNLPETVYRSMRLGGEDITREEVKRVCRDSSLLNWGASLLEQAANTDLVEPATRPPVSGPTASPDHRRPRPTSESDA